MTLGLVHLVQDFLGSWGDLLHEGRVHLLGQSHLLLLLLLLFAEYLEVVLHCDAIRVVVVD